MINEATHAEEKKEHIDIYPTAVLEQLLCKFI